MIQICGAPCCWGVDDPKNPYLPPWTLVLEEAGLAGYSAIELGPYGYMPIDALAVSAELQKNGIAIGATPVRKLPQPGAVNDKLSIWTA